MRRTTLRKDVEGSKKRSSDMARPSYLIHNSKKKTYTTLYPSNPTIVFFSLAFLYALLIIFWPIASQSYEYYDSGAKRTAAINKRLAYESEPPSTTGFIILGMHRSGTSMLAGILATGFGYNLGDNLMEATRDNEKGYFEHWDVVNQNMEFLKKQDMEWNWNVGNYNDAKALNAENFKAGDLALDFFNNETDVPWLQKDPRMCITLKTWLEYITHQPAIVFTYRHPLEVAKSLLKRTHHERKYTGSRTRRKKKDHSAHSQSEKIDEKNIVRGESSPEQRTEMKLSHDTHDLPRRRLMELDRHPDREKNVNSPRRFNRRPPTFSLSLGLWLWIVYNMRAIENSRDLCRVFTSNEEILADPFNEAKRISLELSTKCGLPPPPMEIMQEDIDQLVDPTLQKQRLQGGEGNNTDLSHGCEVVAEFIGTDIEENLYARAMKIYCDLRSGDAYKVGYEWYETEVKDMLEQIPRPLQFNGRHPRMPQGMKDAMERRRKVRERLAGLRKQE